MKRNMKKLLCLLLALAVAAGALTACTGPNLESQPATTLPTTAPTQPKTQPTTVPTQPTTVPTQPEDTTIEVAAQIRFYKYLERFDDATRAEKWPKIINSAEDFNKFLESDYMQTIWSNDLEPLERYDDAFFEENSLVLLCLYDTNGNFCGSFGVDSCVKYDGYYDGYYIVSVGVGDFYCGYFWYNTHYIVFIEINEVVEEHAVFYFEIDGDLGIDEIVLGPTGS